MITTDCHAANDRQTIKRAACFSAIRAAPVKVQATLRDAERPLSVVMPSIDGRVQP